MTDMRPLSAEELKGRLQGVLAFPVTPFGDDGSIALNVVRSNASWLSSSGVGALFSPGGTGEIFGLSPDECAAVTEATTDAVGSQVPVVAGVGFGPRVAADLARRAERAGAAAVLVMPPYYSQPGPDGLLAYYQQVAEATALPIIPYARDGAAFTPRLVESLANRIPTLLAFKDGRGDVRLFSRIRHHVDRTCGADRLVWIAGAGDDLLGAYVTAGAQGFTSSIACFWPEISLELFRLATTGELKGLADLNDRVVAPIFELRADGRGLEVSVMKAAMRLLGYPVGGVRSPLAEPTHGDVVRLDELLRALHVPRAESRRVQP